MRNQALEIFQVALRAVDPVDATLRHVRREGESLLIGERRLELRNFDEILVVGAGKADAPMAQAVESLLGERVSGGVIVVKDGHGLPLQHIKVHEASHPVPDERGLRGAEEILSLVRDAGERDLVICLISGGGSALLVAPAEGVTLKDKQSVTQLLLACGATIHEINTVRKHLSRVKGGGLAHAAHQAEQVLKRYGIWDQAPGSVRAYVEKGVNGEIEETPKPGDPPFQRDAWQLVGTNLQALKAAGKEAERQGYRPLVLSGMMEGETREVAKAHVAIAKEVLNSENPLAAPACILSGGETTVTLQGAGKGGRNTEFALASALALEGVENVVLLSGGTDGTDGPTDAAGAIAHGKTVPQAREKDLDPFDYLRRNDSYTFFEILDDLVITGPTRTNVMDVCVMLVRS
jgi:hydroxypyruvate reductase